MWRRHHNASHRWDAEAVRATRLLKIAGFKVDIHLMHLGKHSENLFGGPNIFGDVVKTYDLLFML